MKAISYSVRYSASRVKNMRNVIWEKLAKCPDRTDFACLPTFLVEVSVGQDVQYQVILFKYV